MTSFYITIYTICGIYLLLNFKFEIQMFQQNSYRIPRYWKWLKGNFGSAWRLVDIAALFLVFSTLLTAPLAAIAVSLIALVKIWLIFRKKYKKPLVFTRRVWRLYSVTAILAVGAYVAMIITGSIKSQVGMATPLPPLFLDFSFLQPHARSFPSYWLQ